MDEQFPEEARGKDGDEAGEDEAGDDTNDTGAESTSRPIEKPGAHRIPSVIVVFLVFVAVTAVVALLIPRLSGPPANPPIPPLVPYVNDLTDPRVLSSPDVDRIDASCLQLDTATSAEFAIVLVETTQPMGINEFAFRTFEANGIGKAGRDNGFFW